MAFNAPIKTYQTNTSTSGGGFKPPIDYSTNNQQQPTNYGIPEPTNVVGKLTKSVVKGIASPFLRTAVTGYNALTGNDLEKSRNIPYYGETKGLPPVVKPGGVLNPQTGGFQNPISGKGLREAVGTGTEIASTVAAPGGASKVVEGGAKELAKQGFIQGLKQGSLFGGLQSFGYSLQKDEVTPGEVAKNTALGAAGGGLVGGVAGGVTGAIKGATDLEHLQGNLKSYYQKMLNLTPKQTALEEKWAKDTPGFLAKEGVTGLNVENGKLEPSEAISQLEMKSNAENSAFHQILQGENKYVSLDELQRKAIESIKSSTKGTAQDKAISAIEKEISAYKSQLSTGVTNNAGEDVIPLDVFNTIKQDLWSKSKGFLTLDDKIYSDASFKTGQVAKKMIEDNLSSADAKLINNRLGDLAQAIKLLHNRTGTKVGASGLTRLVGRGIGAALGAAGGPIDAVLGALTGGKLADILSDPSYSVMFTRKLINRLQESGQSELIDEAQRILEQQGKEQLQRLMLPAPSSIIPPYNGGTPDATNTAINALGHKLGIGK